MFTDQKPVFTIQQIQELRQITIWGVGLIGGSLGLALKKNGFQGKRIGLGRNIRRLEKARKLNAVDVITTDLSEGIQESELVVLCAPVTLAPIFTKQILETLVPQQKRIVITDVGSTKSVIVRTVEEQLIATNSDSVAFVGGHPMAGSHETGVDAANSDLFNNANCLLTPTKNTDKEALQLVENLWNFVGAVPHVCSPEVHDLLVGAASHLPHLMASILTNTVADVDSQEGTALDFTATGFRDSTRIAAGSPELWTGIVPCVTIAIDGPAGSGKSTVARCVAEKLSLLYLDSGAMYRAVTLLAIENGAEENISDLIELVKQCNIEFTENGKRIFLDSVDVSEEIRTPDVNKLVADIAKIPEIRHEIVKHQQRIGEDGNIIAEGRDLTTIVFPDADYKFYLDASIQERAKRRFADLQEQNVKTTIEAVEAEINARDEKDTSREHSPLQVAKDAICVDTTGKTVEEVIDIIVSHIKEK